MPNFKLFNYSLEDKDRWRDDKFNIEIDYNFAEVIWWCLQFTIEHVNEIDLIQDLVTYEEKWVKKAAEALRK